MKKLLLLMLLAAAGRLAALPAPDFDITDTDGYIHTLNSGYVSQGKVVVLEAFFVNCPPCATHAPLLQTLYQTKKAQHPGNVEFLLLTTMGNDHNAQVAQYKINKSLTMPAVSVDGGSLTALAPYLAGNFGPFFGTPTFIVIAPGSGEVFFDVRGSNPQATMDKLSTLIDRLLVPASPLNICPATTATGTAIDNVRYTVDGATWDTSFYAGAYTLANFPALNSPLAPYTISATRTDQAAAGVSTLDLVFMSRHILGIEPLSAPWQIAAADVNSSNSVTTFDILETRKLLLGIYNSFPECPSWRFSPASGTEVNGYCLAFQGIKMGDVNGSYSALVPAEADQRDQPGVPIWAEDRWLAAGETVRVDLRTSAAATWSGLQMSLGFVPEDLEILGLESAALPGFDDGAYYLGRQSEGFASISWGGGTPDAVLPANAAWLTLWLRAGRPLRLSEALRLGALPLRGEAYDDRGNSRPLDLHWSKPAQQTADAVRITPNPARDGFFTVALEATLPGERLVQAFDTRGRLVFSRLWYLEKGANQLELGLLHATPGVYGLVLDGRAVGKLLVL